MSEKGQGKSYCRACRKPIRSNEFRNKISCREWLISGLCQKCQDLVFGED